MPWGEEVCTMNKKDRGENGQVLLTLTEEKLRTAVLESGLPYSEIERRCGVSRRL